MPLLGPFSGNTYASNTAVGTVLWSNASGAQLSDDVYASAGLSSGVISRYLLATSFGFSLSNWNRIYGIVAEVELSADSGSRLQTYSVKLVSDNAAEQAVVDGFDLMRSDNLTTTDTVRTYGSTSSTWGLDWTPARVGLGNFGLAFSVWDSGGGAGIATARVDQIRMTVYYESIRGLESQMRLSTMLVG